MTLLSFEKGGFLFKNGALGTGQGCCCGGCGDPCSKCNQSCISLAISGFSGSSEGPECEECDAINGTYTLVRGTGAPPTISPSIQDTSGTGAVITADLVFRPEDGGWTIGSVGIDKKGTCYTGNAQFAYTLTGAAVACNDPPVVTVEVERTEPLLDLSDIADLNSPAGTGAVLTPVYVPVVTTSGQETWALDSVTVTSGGSDYDDMAAIKIKTKGCTVETKAATALVRVDRSEPQAEAIVDGTGSGAVLELQWTAVPWGPDQYNPIQTTVWVATGVTILSGGSGYSANDAVKFSLNAASYRNANNQQFGSGYFPVIFGLLSASNIGANGEIVGTISGGSLEFYDTSSSIQSVTVTKGGEYYTPGGIKSLALVDGGTFWSTEPCRYSVCAPSACKVNGEEQCRQISLSVGNEDNKLTISIAGSKLAEATLPAEGSSCGSLSFSAEEITSQCAKVGTITLSGTTCTSGPSQDSCCDPCTAPCDAENPCPEGYACVNGQCRGGCSTNYLLPGCDGSFEHCELVPGNGDNQAGMLFITAIKSWDEFNGVQWFEIAFGSFTGWAAGYPQAFNGCPFVVVYFTATNDDPFCAKFTTTVRVYVLNPATGVFDDATSYASSTGGPEVQFAGVECDAGFPPQLTCTPILACNEFP